jgi:3D (Asp-Asp-Asp) domain-containing protein
MFTLLSTVAVWLSFTATAYHCDVVPCLTRSGEWVNPHHQKVMAIDPSVLVMGARYEVRFEDGHVTIYTALDTGTDIQGARVDLLLKTHWGAVQFGRQTVKVRRIP